MVDLVKTERRRNRLGGQVGEARSSSFEAEDSSGGTPGQLVGGTVSVQVAFYG